MYSRLLVPLDGSATAQLALAHAIGLARMTDATVVLLHIVDELDHHNGHVPASVYRRDARPAHLAAGRALLEEAAMQLRREGAAVETVLLECRGQRVSDLIAQQAAASHCDLVVLGSHGRRGVARLVLGSDAEQVARIATVPVMLIRHRQENAPEPSPSRRRKPSVRHH